MNEMITGVGVMEQLIAWVAQHNWVVRYVVIPIIIALIGIFAVKTLTKLSVRGNRGNSVISTGSSNAISSSNVAVRDQIADNNAVQLIGDNLGTLIIHEQFDIKKIEAVIQVMFPLATQALESQRTNAFGFLSVLEHQLSQLPPETKDKFAEADVQATLQEAIRGAARTGTREIHEVLSRLVADRVEKPKKSVAELAINEAISVICKLDENLIKILAFSFLFSRTKYLRIPDNKFLLQKLETITAKFKDMDLSSSKFEYLEAISCGKSLNLGFAHTMLAEIIYKSYPHLFLKRVPLQQIKDLHLPNAIEENFIKDSDGETTELDSILGLYLFENFPVNFEDGTPLVISDEAHKKLLTETYQQNKLSLPEVRAIFQAQIPDYEKIDQMWIDGHFNSFTLTAVGIAIGRAYLEHANLGNYDINVWIN